MFVTIYSKADLINIMTDNYLCCEPDCPQETRNNIYDNLYKMTEQEMISKFQQKAINVVRIGCDQFIIDFQSVYENYGK